MALPNHNHIPPTSIRGIANARDPLDHVVQIGKHEILALSIKIECQEFDLWHLWEEEQVQVRAAIEKGLQALGDGISGYYEVTHGSIWVRFVGFVKSGANAVAVNATRIARSIKEGVQSVWDRSKSALVTAGNKIGAFCDKVGEFMNTKPVRITVKVGYSVITAMTAIALVASFLDFPSAYALLAAFPFPDIPWS